jgi:hypothetical protein
MPVKSVSHVPEAQPAERVELSTEIAGLVAQVLRGEAVDTAAKGEELAARYPQVGMSGAMIGEAIVRATGMMSMIRERPQPPERASRSTSINAHQASNGAVVDAAGGNSGSENSNIAIDDGLAAAIDADIGGLVAAAGGKSSDADAIDGSPAAAGTQGGAAGAFAKGAVAALRRALFKG